MKKLSIIFITFNLLVFALRCKSSLSNEEKEFIDYLALYKLAPKNNHVYIFVPSTQCVNCIKLNARNLTKLQNEKTFIFSNFKQKHFLNFQNYKYDKADAVTSLKFVNLENKIIFYANDRIVFCKTIEINVPANSCTID